MKYHLIGINHMYQFRNYHKADWQAFETYLFSLSLINEIDLLAEELNENAIKKWEGFGATGSVAKNVARCLGIRHLFCDPTPRERKQLGIPDREEIASCLGFSKIKTLEQSQILSQREREFWHHRERFWLQKLRATNSSSCIFILGTQHVTSFQVRLENEGVNVQVDWNNWHPE